jgi:guanidinopropionase
MRRAHRVHGIYPYDLANVADLGDAPTNPADLMDSIARIEGFASSVVARGAMPLAAGGDHLISLPLLRAVAKKHGPVGMVHFDSHSDTWDEYFGGYKYTHGTPFRRAIEEGILDPKRTIQIGIRGGLYDLADNAWAEAQGIRIIYIEEFFEIGVTGVIAEAHRVVGSGPTYISFDVDGIDPTYTPGTGTPEVGGYTPAEAQQMLRGLKDLNLVGADVVEVSPPFDQSGNTALVAATLMFEILCLFAMQIGKATGRG